jgi:Spy/CpxP family protein refolding chaperone
MRKTTSLALAIFFASALMFQATADSPDKKPVDKDTKKAKDFSDSPLVKKMMAFNKKRDGKLTKDEVTDKRCHRIFDRADKNKDGVVTKAELIALAAEMAKEDGDEGGGGRGGRGERGGFGGPGGPGGGRPGFGGLGQPGQILPPFLVERLKLTADQKKDLAALQKDVDAKLAKILTAEQKKMIKNMGNRGGRGGFGGGRGGEGGGRGGRGGQEGGPGGRGGPDRPRD